MYDEIKGFEEADQVSDSSTTATASIPKAQPPKIQKRVRFTEPRESDIHLVRALSAEDVQRRWYDGLELQQMGMRAVRTLRKHITRPNTYLMWHWILDFCKQAPAREQGYDFDDDSSDANLLFGELAEHYYENDTYGLESMLHVAFRTWPNKAHQSKAAMIAIKRIQGNTSVDSDTRDALLAKVLQRVSLPSSVLAQEIAFALHDSLQMGSY